MSSRRFFILSLLLHGLFLWNFLSPQEIKIENTLAEVSFIETAKIKHIKSHTQQESLQKTLKAENIPATKLDLGLSTKNAINQTFLTKQQSEPNGDSTGTKDNSSDVTFDPYGGLEMPEIRYVQSLWHQIDKAIVNPSYLSEYGHFGKVHFTFDINPDGNLLENSIRVQADDRVLKVIAARAIRKAILNANGELQKPRQLTRISSTFTWSDYQTCANLRGSGKNSLSFCNYAEDKRKQFTTGEKVATYVGALRYGFDAVDAIQQYNREQMHLKTQFNPFAEFERDPDWDLGS